MDIRIIQLAKWQIPKSRGMFELEEEGEGAYLAIGYFDMIDIVNVKEAQDEKQRDRSEHPFSQAYLGLPRHEQANTSEEFTMQELILFTDVEEKENSKEKIAQFWEDESLLMYISLIHVDNESDIDKIIARIQEEFKDQQYLYYFSFDYSGIVLLAKNMEIKAYTSALFHLNYSNAGNSKLIRDSFSLFGLNKKRLKTHFEQAKRGYTEIKGVSDDETFSVVVNIGVQNFNKYTEFIQEVKDKTDVTIEERGLLGRHDVSIIRDECNLKWLIYLQYLLDKYTTNQKDADYGQLFSTYETFVKVELEGTLADTEDGGENVYYKGVEEKLNGLCKEFSTKLQDKKKFYNGEYQIPVRAVKHSILSILKNRFAEDFVLCMYSSFCEFLLYLIEKISSCKSDKDDPEAFEECYGEYFRGLNSLVNSAMHSERQFIQATAFNALIYDVPSKIMAFYVAMIHDIQEIIRSNEDKNYTFLLTPSFSNEICVKTISYQKEELPHDRILMVSINEKSLYNPRGVSRRMAHEVAHYVGDEIRNRQKRKECFELSVIYIILNCILHSAFIETEMFYPLIENIWSVLPGDKRFAPTEMNYSEDLIKVGAQIAEEFSGNPEIIQLLNEHICNIVGGAVDKKEQLKNYISQIIELRTGSSKNILGEILTVDTWSDTEIGIMVNLIMGDVKEKINHINRDQEYLLSVGELEQSVALNKLDRILERKTIGEFAAMLKSIYSEAFADIQMILLLDFGYEDYLKGFLIDENIDLAKLQSNMEDLSRISMVVFTMNLVGMWDGVLRENYFNGNNSDIQKLHKIIRRECIAMRQGVDFEDKDNLNNWRKNIYEFKCKIGIKAEYKDIKEEEFFMDITEENVDDRMINVYINNQLFRYLMDCTEKGIAQYSQKDGGKIEHIKKLKNMINTVIECTNMRETFKAVCQEVKEYRETIFSGRNLERTNAS